MQPLSYGFWPYMKNSAECGDQWRNAHQGNAWQKDPHKASPDGAKRESKSNDDTRGSGNAHIVNHILLQRPQSHHASTTLHELWRSDPFAALCSVTDPHCCKMLSVRDAMEESCGPVLVDTRSFVCQKKMLLREATGSIALQKRRRKKDKKKNKQM